MSRFLMIDVGAGTMDVLYYDTNTDLHYKAVVKSPVRHLAEKVLAMPGDLLVTGCEMGGGPITKALRERARTANVVVSAGAAATLHHDLAGFVPGISASCPMRTLGNCVAAAGIPN